VLTRLLNKLNPHHQVFVKEPSRVLLVGPDATDDCRQMNNEVRLRVDIKPFYVRQLYQIIVNAAWRKYFHPTEGLETLNDKPPQKTTASGDDYPLVRKTLAELFHSNFQNDE
jgi:hypothetical protein